MRWLFKLECSQNKNSKSSELCFSGELGAKIAPGLPAYGGNGEWNLKNKRKSKARGKANGIQKAKRLAEMQKGSANINQTR